MNNLNTKFHEQLLGYLRTIEGWKLTYNNHNVLYLNSRGEDIKPESEIDVDYIHEVKYLSPSLHNSLDIINSQENYPLLILDKDILRGTESSKYGTLICSYLDEWDNIYYFMIYKSEFYISTDILELQNIEDLKDIVRGEESSKIKFKIEEHHEHEIVIKLSNILSTLEKEIAAIWL